MDERTDFMGLVLGDDTLETPAGRMPLTEITRAEFVRDVVPDGPGPTTTETSGSAVVGGAVVGGALLGGAGALGGALLGSTVAREVPGEPEFHTASVKLVFETGSSDFSMDIPRDKEHDAHKFAQVVARAAKHAGRS